MVKLLPGYHELLGVDVGVKVLSISRQALYSDIRAYKGVDNESYSK